MPELDEMLRSDVSAAAARSVVPPDFSGVAVRGRQRRARRVAVLASAGVVVLAGAAVLTGVGAERSTTPDPAVPTPTPSPSATAGVGAEEIVDDPESVVVQVVAAPGAPQVRAVVWSRCPDDRCRRPEAAVALTADGFDTRTVLRLGRSPSLEAAGPSAFLGRGTDGDPFLLLLDGTKVGLHRPTDVSPVGPGEVVGRWWGSGDADFYAVDPANGDTHLVPVPDGLVEVRGDGTGRLEGISGFGPDSVFMWSEDGGETWSEHDLPGEETSMFGLTPSGDPGTAAVIGGADGATLFPFIDVSRLDRRSGTWQQVLQPRDPRAYIGPQAVLPDGRLLVNVQVWSDATFKKPGARPAGVYTSDGADWSTLQRLEPGENSGLAPVERERALAGHPGVVGLSVEPGEVTVYVANGGGSSLVYAITDSGSRWDRVAVR
jgi:hypothetical protein